MLCSVLFTTTFAIHKNAKLLYIIIWFILGDTPLH